jgi:hypothetical protein
MSPIPDSVRRCRATIRDRRHYLARQKCIHPSFCMLWQKTVPRLKATMPRKVEKARMKAMAAAAMAVPLQHHGAHIVVQHLARRAAECQKRVLVRLDRRFDPLVAWRPGSIAGRDKYRKPVAAAPDNRPVDLHLFARRGLESDERRRRPLRHERGHQLLQHRVTAGIPALAQFPQQHARWDPLRRCRGQPLQDVILEPIELCPPRRTRLVARRRFFGRRGWPMTRPATNGTRRSGPVRCAIYTRKSSEERLEMTLRAWCTEHALHGRNVTQTDARGILISVLTTLAVDTTSRLWRPPRPRYAPPDGAAGKARLAAP